MAATYQIDAFHGKTPIASVWPNLGYFRRYDSDPTSSRSTSFIPRPSSGRSFSWRKNIKLHFLTAPLTAIANLRVFTAGTPITGYTLYATLNTDYVPASRADIVQPIEGGIDLLARGSGNPFVIVAGTVLTAPATGYGNQPYLTLQSALDDDADPGIQNIQLFFQFDET